MFFLLDKYIFLCFDIGFKPLYQKNMGFKLKKRIMNSKMSQVNRPRGFKSKIYNLIN